jgi:hypothetical protein
MHLGMSAYRRFQELEEACARLGFCINSGGDHFNHNSIDYIGLSPSKENLPAYSRDAMIYRGDLDGCLQFLHGWQTCLFYLEMVGAVKKDTVAKAERKHLEVLESARTLYALKNGKDPGDLRKKSNRAKLEDDAVPF